MNIVLDRKVTGVVFTNLVTGKAWHQAELIPSGRINDWLMRTLVYYKQLTMPLPVCNVSICWGYSNKVPQSEWLK